MSLGVKMLSYLAGIIKKVHDQVVIIDVSGVGFSLQVPNGHVFEIGKKIDVPVYLHWNQEQGPSLFGFNSELEKTIFILVIGCSGIGPKLGLALLYAMTPQAFLQAVAIADYKALSAVSGVGTKKAESIVLQLKDKVGKLIDKQDTAISGSTVLHNLKNVSEVLQSLDYSRPEINRALEHLKSSQIEQAGFDELMRKALSFLAQKSL